ncbi:MAG: hypothetical protein GX270_06170 [Clostridiaceae bacterium]|nr:hypothetical protein [Clostridiaceae bacterium]
MKNEDIDFLRKKLDSLYLPMLLFTAILVLICGVYYKYSEVDFIKNAVKTSANIIDIAENNCPIVSFEVNGINYLVRAKSSINKINVGEIIEIEYHKNKPKMIEVNRDNPFFRYSIWMIILGIIGTIVISVLIFNKPFTFLHNR